MWNSILDRYLPLFPKYMCKEYNESLNVFIKEGMVRKGYIPQLNELSKYLEAKNNMKLKPIFGRISYRDLIYCWAFNVFTTGVNLRHPASLE